MTRIKVTIRMFHKDMYVDPNINWKSSCLHYCKFGKICTASYGGRWGDSFYNFCYGKRYIGDFTILGVKK